MHRLAFDTPKARLRSILQTEDKESSYLAKSTAFAAVQTTLNVLKEFAETTGIPSLQEGVNALAIVYDVMQVWYPKTSQNADDVESFAECIEGLAETLKKTTQETWSTDLMQDRINRLSKTWTKSTKEVQEIGSRNYMKRLLNRDNDAGAITDQIATITWSIHSFTVESMLAIEFALDDARQSTGQIEGKVDYVQQSIQDIKMRQEIYGGSIPHAITARYDCNDKLRPCHKGTRADILGMIYHWVEYGDVMSPVVDALEDKLQTARVFWINGLGSAGTGKSTIAYTVAKHLDEHRKLGASFFCSRDNADCSNPKLIIPTIAYQLGQFCPPFREQVCAVLDADPNVVYSVVPRQLEKLLVTPLHTMKGEMPFCVVVIDALDECQDGGASYTILSSLAQHITNLSPVKFLITSRPDHHIVRAFKMNRLSQTTQRYILHHVEQKVVETDLLLYLHSSLQKTKQTYKLNASWPSMAEIKALVHLSSGLFQFAATAVKFIEDKNYRNPAHRLACLLGMVTDVDSSQGNLLDQLYIQVLQNAFPNVSSEDASRLKMILGSVIHLCDPLSSSNLEQLLGLHIPLSATLQELQSVVIIPDDSNDVIGLIHPSFYDFLTNPSRCLDTRFLVTPMLQHSFLAEACLKAMKMLTQDICKIRQPWKLHHELGNLSQLVHKKIPPYLQYACQHWSRHLLQGLLSDKILSVLEEFYRKYLLFWVEVCSLLGNLQGALSALKSIHQLLSASVTDIKISVALLHDCQQLIREFFPLLRIASSQTYVSVPAFIPKCTELLKLYHQEFQNSVKTVPHENRPQNWNTCLWTMDEHTAQVHATTFSPDSNYIVSASSDHTVQLWDAANGTHVTTFKGHKEAVSCTVFSSDGVYLITGSNDGTVKVWNAITGELLNSMDSKSEVTSVAFSSKGDHVAFGCNDWDVKSWKPWEHQAIPRKYPYDKIGQHSSGVTAVDFSPNGDYVVSGSTDTTIQLWSANPETLLLKAMRKFKGHSKPVHDVAFSHSGTYIVSGSADSTVCVWNVKNGSQIRRLKGHLSSVNSVSFSPNDREIISASSDKTIQLWSTKSGDPLKAFIGHSDSVVSVAFSNDGTQIVSASKDRTVKVWDAYTDTNQNVQITDRQVLALCSSPNGVWVVSVLSNHSMDLLDVFTGLPQQTLKGHSASVNSVVFSPDSSTIASGSDDNFICLWNTSSGSCVHILKGHVGPIRSVKFLADGTSIVSGSVDKTVQLWNVTNGEHIKTFVGHSKLVSCIAVSSDSNCIASASYDTTVQLWNLVDHSHLHTFDAHSQALYAVAFSPNNKIVASASIDQSVQLSDVESGTTLKILNHNLSVNHRHHIHFSSNQAFIVIGSHAIQTDLAPLNSKPPNMADQQLLPYYCIEAGWIVSIESQQRICWVPQAYRGLLVSTTNGAALRTQTGQVIILDFSQVHLPK